jgi:hypothetical protein
MSDDADAADIDALDEDDPATAFERVSELPGTHLRAAEFWDDIVGDMEATAGEYETESWETLQLHPGDVTALVPDGGPTSEADRSSSAEGGESDGDRDRFGLDVLVPDDEFADLGSLLEGGVSFDSYEVFRATAEGLVLFVVAMEDPDAEVAVLYPAYYDVEDAQPMLAAAEKTGEMRTYVRTLTNEQVEFTHEEPENFAPEPAEGEAES